MIYHVPSDIKVLLLKSNRFYSWFLLLSFEELRLPKKKEAVGEVRGVIFITEIEADYLLLWTFLCRAHSSF